MSKRFIVMAVAAVVIIAVVLAVSFQPVATNVDYIGGKYDATITHYTDHSELTYTDESGQHSSSNFDDAMKPGLLCINSSTPQNATFLCWWDYGHMIKAVGERNVIVRNPSQEILDSIADPSGLKEFDPSNKIVDVATALTTTNQSQTLQIMAKYNTTYLMVHKDDLVKSVWFFRIAGLNNTDYVNSQGFTDLGNNTMIARLLDKRDTGLTLVYHDEQMKIYRIPDA
jgi:asparagine N-glycosylation enzyme membrane subunit Stt3